MTKKTNIDLNKHSINFNKKIVFIANILTHHQIFNARLINKMADQGWDVKIISFKDTTLKIEEKPNLKFVNWDVNRTSINPLREFKSFFSLCRIIAQEKPNIIHNFTIKANIYGTFAGKIFSRAKIINTVNGLGYTYVETDIRSWMKRTIIKIIWLSALNLSKVILFLNKDDRKIFKRYLFFSKTDIVPGHGIDMCSFNRNNLDVHQLKKIKKEIGQKKNQLVVTTAGRLIKQKGIIEFWQAAKKIIAEFPNVVFVVVGMIDNCNPSKISAAEVKMMRGDNFQFLNNRSDVKEILSVSDIFVLASYREGGPQVIIEAMAMGLPIVATNVAGCRERVKMNVNGLLVPVKNSLALYKAIKSLLMSKKLREKMGKESFKFASAMYNSEFLTDKVIKYYLE